jgi:hypothetical protein
VGLSTGGGTANGTALCRVRRDEVQTLAGHKSLVRSLISNVVDVRDAIQIAYDQLAKRAKALLV